MNRKRERLDFAEVKDAARGRWGELLPSLLGWPAETCDGRNRPCPRCGGEDRFRFVDYGGDGSALCNQCAPSGLGDGFDVVGEFGGCSKADALRKVAQRLGIDGEASAIGTPPASKALNDQKSNGLRKIVATYPYRDEHASLLFEAVRYEPKDFRQRRPDGNGGWKWSTKGVRQVPYRLPELLDALKRNPRRPVFVVEGEKDVEALTKLDVVATCNAGGSGKWTAEHSEHLRGADIVILPDNDESGRDHARKAAATLFGVAKSVRIVELPGLPEKGDASDWIATGGTKEALRDLLRTAPAWNPEAEVEAKPEWPEIEGFDATSLPSFPVDALPSPLREWVEAEAHATQTPTELAGLIAMAVCSAGVARKVTVEPWEGWTEPTNLFVAVLLESGNRKSAVFGDATKPIRELETELIDDAKPFVAREASVRRQKEKRLAALEKKIAEGKNEADDRDEAAKLAEALATDPVPVLPRLRVDDATSEKLEMMLKEQGGRIASMSPEGGVFDVMAGLYSKSGGAQFDVYLKGHAGDDLRTDRVGREGVDVPRPALTCAYAIQPQVIEGLAENPAFRGRGLLARFLYALPESRIGEREIRPEPVPRETANAYSRAVRRLFQETPDRLTLSLTAPAVDVFAEWCEQIETLLGDDGDLETVRDWGSKLWGATLRIAAVLHCVGEGTANATIASGTIENAVRIARYLIPHAEAVLRRMHANNDGGDADARYVLRWIVRHERRTFSIRDLYQHARRRFDSPDDQIGPLAELERRGYVRRVQQSTEGPGRKPSPAYESNPAIFGDGKQETRSRNSRDAEAKNGERSGDGDSVNSVNGSLPCGLEKCDARGADDDGRERVTI